MAKWRALPAATTSQQGLVEAGHGIAVPSPGTFDQVVATGQLWVDPNGNDTTGDGSSGNPFLTLTHTFAYIVAHPLTAGYDVYMPPVNWEENVALPPPNTTLVGSDQDATFLSAVGGSPLSWVQTIGQESVLEFRNMGLLASITGGNAGGSSLELLFYHAFVVGTLTLIGSITLDGSTFFNSTFVNCGNVVITNPAAGATLAADANLSFSYDPVSGTNGTFTPGLTLLGGTWNSIAYSATATGAPLEIIGARVQNVTAQDMATIQCRATRVMGQLNAQDPSALIEYDMPSVHYTPTFAGSGSFKLAEFAIIKTLPMGFVSGNVTVPIPTSGYGSSQIPDVLGQSNLPGTIITYVSNTSATLTVYVQTNPSPAPSAFQITLLVKP
jgi:hypothetical protein